MKRSDECSGSGLRVVSSSSRSFSLLLLLLLSRVVVAVECRLGREVRKFAL
jgi:hypothetical protein